MAHDLFSEQAHFYKAFRPVYPPELYRYILSFVEKRNAALDVATGNGQAAAALAPYFKHVTAIDISAPQLAQAEQRENITYRQASAEATFSKPHAFDLITVAQAYHWLYHDAFATEVRRVARPGAVLAVWGYGRFTTGNAALNQLMDAFYFDILGPYWDAARVHVDSHYSNLPFPFQRLPTASFFIEVQWTKETLTGYLQSWSAVQTYIQTNGRLPLLLIEAALHTMMGAETSAVRFPLFLHLGKIVG